MAYWRGRCGGKGLPNQGSITMPILGPLTKKLVASRHTSGGILKSLLSSKYIQANGKN